MAGINPDFMKFLDQFPEVFGKLLAIANEWYKLQGELPTVPTEEGPDEFEIGGEVGLKTVGISHAEIDAVTKGYAEAAVKEKCIAYIKGFIAGVMMTI